MSSNFHGQPSRLSYDKDTLTTAGSVVSPVSDQNKLPACGQCVRCSVGIPSVAVVNTSRIFP